MRKFILSMSLNIISPSPSVEGATPDGSANEHGLQLVLARPCVQKAIEERGSYTRNAITSIVARGLDKSAKDPLVIAAVDFVRKELEGKGVTICSADDSPMTSPEERKAKVRKYLRRNRAAERNRELQLQAEAERLRDHPDQAHCPTSSSIVPQCPSEQFLPLAGVDGFPQALINLLEKEFARVMEHAYIQEGMKQKKITRYRIGGAVGTALSQGSLRREDVITILTYNVIRAFRESGCEIITPENRPVKDLTVPLKRSRESLCTWFKGVTNYACKQRAVGDPDVGDTPDGLDGSFNVAKYNEYLTRGIDPRKSTKAMGGSEGKVRMLEARYAAGLPLWNDKDGPVDNENPPGVIQRRPSRFLALSASDDDDNASDDETDDVEEDSDQDDTVAGVDVVEEEFA